MYVDNPPELVSSYTKFYDLAFYYKPDAKNILMLGGGGYCVPRHLLAAHPDVSVDVVELDPGITDIARKYFTLTDDPRMRIFHEDARTFLNREEGMYDAVFMDTFTSWTSIPFQMTTMETARHIRNILKPDGVLIINIIASVKGRKSGVFNGIYKAYSTAFPAIMIFPVSAPDPKYAMALQNIILAAQAENIAVTPDPKYASMLAHQWLEPFVPDPNVPAFRDDFAPVERYALMQN